jgi:hypothetical protein
LQRVVEFARGVCVACPLLVVAVTRGVLVWEERGGFREKAEWFWHSRTERGRRKGGGVPWVISTFGMAHHCALGVGAVGPRGAALPAAEARAGDGKV